MDFFDEFKSVDGILLFWPLEKKLNSKISFPLSRLRDDWVLKI